MDAAYRARRKADPGTLDARQAEVDDHGEEIPAWLEGPDLFIGLQVPPGRYELGLYFVNKDGHEGHNRFRDLRLQIKEMNVFGLSLIQSLPQETFQDYEKKPILAEGRVSDYWGGTYKRFLIEGAGSTPCESAAIIPITPTFRDCS